MSVCVSKLTWIYLSNYPTIGSSGSRRAYNIVYNDIEFNDCSKEEEEDDDDDDSVAMDHI